ncbi:MAG TPA: MerR family transcriptional regulator [Ilumatobacteraceae bacterium]|nr:MerR family transcriptional regulator [Ilumatobacteraceae bacterium]
MGVDTTDGAAAGERMHQIGEVAEAVGLSLRTIRYYEEAGLVLASGRSTGGFRLYTAADIDRLRLVKHMKPLELTIEEMRDLLATRDQLADATTSEHDRSTLLDRLSMFAELAEERCQRLRDHVDAAESISRTLRAELDAAAPVVHPSR